MLREGRRHVDLVNRRLKTRARQPILGLENTARGSLIFDGGA
jgi:hypothetical protein